MAGSSAHGCPVERKWLSIVSPAQLQIPLAGLGPAIHAFYSCGGAVGEDVGGRNKSGHGE